MKPECGEYQKRISKSLVGDLAADEQHLLDQHLATCPDCRSERESFIQTLNLIQSVEEKPVPRHFFVHPDKRKLSPWELFRLMEPRWQAVTAAIAGLFILISIGWATSFGRDNIDVAALKKEILKSVEEQNRFDRNAWLQEAHAEIARSRMELTQQQKVELTGALASLDSRITGRLRQGEARMKDNTQAMAVAIYNTVARQRAQDLNLVNLRFDSIQTNSAIKEQQTDVILDTLLQVAELRLR
jgi:hypothetical protein